MTDINKITDECMAGAGCTGVDAMAMCENISLDELKPGATKIREHFFSKTIHFCAIVNARSGACKEDCKFCAQSGKHKTGVDIYKLRDSEHIRECAAKMNNSGADTFGIVTSGPTVNEGELEDIGSAVENILSKTKLKPCASLGKLNEKQFLALKAKGLKRFHHNLETSENFFPNICSTHSWSERVETIKAAKRAGLEVCCGGLFGMGESWQDRVDLALTLRELEIKSIPLNFLNPVSGTALEELEPMGADEALRIIAVFRFLLPDATLRICGGRPAILKERQREMFACGANALMTGDYLTVGGYSPADDKKLVADLGLSVLGC